MSRVAYDGEGSSKEVRAGVAKRLRARGPEIEQAIFTRVCEAAFGEVGVDDAEYVAGLSTTISAVVEFAIASLELGEDTVGAIPSVAVAQARRAARVGVSLDTVLRRYIAGHALMADFIVEGVECSSFAGDKSALHHELRTTQTPLLERLTASIIEEYNQELERVGRLPEQRRAECVSKLLAGKPLYADGPLELDYDLDAWHIGVVAIGARALEFVRTVAAATGCEHLSVSPGGSTVWVWFGRRRQPTAVDIKQLSSGRPEGVSVAMGEPRQGIEGWRLTHREAQAALLVARRKPPGLTRCSDVLLEAAMLHHDALATSLVETFLSPLDGLGYRGQTARDTLRAYFETRRNVSSTATRLGVVRNTVENRLREIEERLGRPLHRCSAQLEVALRLEALEDSSADIGLESLAPNWPEVSGRTVIGDPIEQSAQPAKRTLSTLAIHSRVSG